MTLQAAPPVAASEYDRPGERTRRCRERAARRTMTCSRWWWAPMVVVLALMGLWGVLRADQFLSGVLVWPRQGARFVEVSNGLPTAGSAQPGGSMTVVISGLNTKSGTAVATALLPALSRDGGRVFSLVYGSGIADEDLIAKYDALVETVRPVEVTFFGSSMGGDIALDLAAHAHRLREGAADAGRAPTGSAAADGAPAVDPLGGSGDGVGTANGPGAAVEASVATAVAAVLGLVRSPSSAGAVGAIRDVSGGTPGRGPGGSTMPVGTAGATARGGASDLPPRVRSVYLDCTPLGADDVRDRSRTSADLMTALTEAVGTDGGAATRIAVEVLVQRGQWSSGLLPAVSIRWDDLWFKYDQVLREKIRSPGISTSLVKDQYGVIRRMDADARFADLAGGYPVRIVYFRPVDASSDTVVAVERVTRELGRLAVAHDVPVRVVGVEDGHHASAQSDPAGYLAALDSAFPGRVISGDPGDVTVLAAGQG